MISRNDGTNGNGKRKARKGKKRGRKPTWTPEMLDTVLRAVEKGHSLTSAAWMVGRRKTTVESWFRRDPELRAKLKLARGNSANKAVESLWTHIENGNWPALERYLKSRVPGFGDRQRQRVDVKHSGSIERKGPQYTTPPRDGSDEQLTDAEYAEMLANRLKALERNGGG